MLEALYSVNSIISYAVYIEVRRASLRKVSVATRGLLNDSSNRLEQRSAFELLAKQFAYLLAWLFTD